MMDLTPDRLVEMYGCMRLIRRFENKVVEMVNTNEIPGTTHEYVGQEAVAVGVCAALREADGITSTHRGHGHILAKGGDPRRVMAELFGRADGYNRGRGGSMHIADLALGIYGANGLVGAGTPIACGAALAAKREGRGRVVTSFFGDGAINQGVVHEAMNLAAIWKLPVVFVCENNSYAITASIRDMLAISRIADRAAAYGFPGEQVDGMDVLAVHAAAARAVAWGPDVKAPPLGAGATLPGKEVFVDLARLIDVEAEIARKRQELEKLDWLVAAKRKKLANEDFVARAPEAVVNKERESLKELEQQHASTSAVLDQMVALEVPRKADDA